MSTRSHIQFKSRGTKFQLYKHWDGYPSSTIPMIQDFIKWNGSRSDDISYTVANFFAWAKISGVFHDLAWYAKSRKENPKDKYYQEMPKTFLEYFQDKNGPHMSKLHTGFGMVEPTDKIIEEWLYIVDLDKKQIEIVSEISENTIIGFSEEMTEKQLEVLEN